MRRVLVPLDGTDLATSIYPDAVRLAGPEGELILVRCATGPAYNANPPQRSASYAFDQVKTYLDTQAQSLRARGINVQTDTLVLDDAASEIDDAAVMLGADMIACATHGRGSWGRLIHGGVAWQAVSHSRVPVLLRHVKSNGLTPDPEPEQRRILVPLDGSQLAERALPLAQQLSREWNAPLHLVRVAVYPFNDWMGMEATDLIPKSKEYLHQVVGMMPDIVRAELLIGPVILALATYIGDLAITDVVMASHGRTGLPRLALGSVADSLIHRLSCPIEVIPSLAATRSDRREQESSSLVTV